MTSNVDNSRPGRQARHGRYTFVIRWIDEDCGVRAKAVRADSVEEARGDLTTQTAASVQMMKPRCRLRLVK